MQNKIGESQLCLGGVIGKDSCGGDSGGPIMKVSSLNYKFKLVIISITIIKAIKSMFFMIRSLEYVSNKIRVKKWPFL